MSVEQTSSKSGFSRKVVWLKKKLRARSAEYEHEAAINREAFRTTKEQNLLYSANRYEGIATGTRWVLEDLKRAKI